jgi:hypothetical protein
MFLVVLRLPVLLGTDSALMLLKVMLLLRLLQC